jgi:mannose-1-phosphate guanylyltransferase
MKFVIMAGGSGSKLWPYSRVKAPKQFIKIIGEKTLFQMTVNSLLKRYAISDIFVSTTSDLIHFVEEQTPEIPKENYIVEPVMRDTGPASCLAMAKIAVRYPDEVVYFYVQSVAVREPEERFLDMIGEMEKLVLEKGKLVTGTMIPEYAETGSDLFKMGKKTTLNSEIDVYEVDEFINVVKERMTLDQVTEISKKFVVGTHTNHYVWRPAEFFEAIKKVRLDWFGVIGELKSAFGKENESELIRGIYTKFEPDRFEVITTELIKEGKVMAMVLPFKWTHITTWDDVYRFRLAKGLPTMEGESVEIESSGNLVITKGKKMVAMVGMKDVAVIETDDAILIAPRVMSNKVKEVTDKLQTEGKTELL